MPGQNALLKVLEEPPSYGVFLLLTDNPDKILPTVRSRCTELKMTGLPDALLRDQLTKAYPKAEQELIDGAISRCGGYLGQAKAILEEGSALAPQTESFVNAFCAKDSLMLQQTLVSMEKLKRDQLMPLLEQWLGILENALVCRCGMQAASSMARQLAASRSLSDLMDAVSKIKKCLEYAQGNVSVAAICGYLAWHLR